MYGAAGVPPVGLTVFRTTLKSSVAHARVSHGQINVERSPPQPSQREGACPPLPWRLQAAYESNCQLPCSGGYVIRLHGEEPTPALVQADMLSACMEYEDMLSDKQRGCSAVYFGFKILILGSGGKAHPSPPKGREPDCSAVCFGLSIINSQLSIRPQAAYFGFKILILGSGGKAYPSPPKGREPDCSAVCFGLSIINSQLSIRPQAAQSPLRFKTSAASGAAALLSVAGVVGGLCGLLADTEGYLCGRLVDGELL